jgi:hypothetical protein
MVSFCSLSTEGLLQTNFAQILQIFPFWSCNLSDIHIGMTVSIEVDTIPKAHFSSLTLLLYYRTQWNATKAQKSTQHIRAPPGLTKLFMQDHCEQEGIVIDAIPVWSQGVWLCYPCHCQVHQLIFPARISTHLYAWASETLLCYDDIQNSTYDHRDWCSADPRCRTQGEKKRTVSWDYMLTLVSQTMQGWSTMLAHSPWA